MSSPFKDGVDAGLSDLKSVNNDLGGASIDADPANFAAIARTAGRVPDFVSRMQTGFQRIGENLTGDTKSWADQQKQRLQVGCDNVQRDAASLTSLANTAQDAVKALQDLGDPGDDDEKKSQVTEAGDTMRAAITAVDQQLEQSRENLSLLYDAIRGVNDAFKTAIAQAKSTVDAGQGPVDQALNDMLNIENQVAGRRDELKSLQAQLASQQSTYDSMQSRIDDKVAQEKAADRAVSDAVKKDPPLSASDMQNLEQAAASARQDRERAEADRASFFTQSVRTAWDAQNAKNDEMYSLTKQWSALKQRRDTAINTLNNARTALSQFNLEYEEPSL